jgi:hypothetical protein
MVKPFVPTDSTFAGHGLKSLTAEVTEQGMTYLQITAGETRVLITLLPSEVRKLTAALNGDAGITDIAHY